MKTLTNITYPAFALFAFVCFSLSPQAQAACQNGCDTSNYSTFLGEYALVNNTGDWNTAVGYWALNHNTTGSNNTATGSDALPWNTTGNYNTATGASALFDNREGSSNTATGSRAFTYNITGSYNGHRCGCAL